MNTARKLVALFGGSYTDKVLKYGPISYWPLWEASGSEAVCQVNVSQNGSYNGSPSLGQPGIGDGRTCPLFDNSDDYVDIYTTAFRDVFDGAEGTVALWAKVAAGVWTDGNRHWAFELRADSQNYIEARKDTSNNVFRFNYEAGNILDWVSVTSYSPSDWFHVATTWSVVADELKCFLEGIQRGNTQTGLGTWVGNLSSVLTLIGADNQTPGNPWSGNLAHMAVFDKALTPSQIAILASV